MKAPVIATVDAIFAGLAVKDSYCLERHLQDAEAARAARQL